ncbi:MAG TPA: Type 1 glutamine amidotransferase-like domain-containing protein [Actinomycetota bacterium]|nr:Type 1 glutamine amidotransferase-like domain-containing protein [Actinomycetota bacterium]
MPQNRRFLLLGSGEFESWSEEPERVALDGADPRVAILPTASAPEGDAVFDRWGRMGLEHYRAMGWAADVVPVKTRLDAERQDLVAAVERAGLVYFSGGNPRHLGSTIEGSALWLALTAALDRGAVYAGCSAGAMVASQSRAQARERRVGASWTFGLGLVPHVSFGVHWDRMGKIPGMRWWVTSRIPESSWFVGIDERTAILGDGERWTVFGRGGVMVVHGGSRSLYPVGETFETSADGRA